MTENENQQDEPKIIVDDDWKAQAKAEKEKLASETESSADAGPGEAGGPGGPGGPRDLPPASLVTLINSMATQVLMALGGYEDPQTKRRYVDLDLAKHFIDTLTVLEEKTKGNLTDDEKKLLDQRLYETRMQYVQVAQVAQAGPIPGAPAPPADGGQDQ